MKGIIESALTTSMSADQYQSMLLDYAAKGKTSGQDQKEDLIHYTKLNAQRSKRINKTAVLNPSVISKAGSLTAQTWILITETWCGDAANSVPVIAKIAALNPKVNLRIVLRDENLELMDQFLTKSELGLNVGRLVVVVPFLDHNMKLTVGYSIFAFTPVPIDFL